MCISFLFGGNPMKFRAAISEVNSGLLDAAKDDTYLLRVVNVTAKLTANNDPMLNIQSVVVANKGGETQFAGKSVFGNIIFFSDNPNAMAFTERALLALGLSLEAISNGKGKVEFDTNDLMGKEFYAVVKANEEFGSSQITRWVLPETV